MTDLEWIKAVRKYAADFGSYAFSQAERKRMLPYIRGNLLKVLHDNRFGEHMHCNTVLTYDFLAEMERGMVDTITAKLTQ